LLKENRFLKVGGRPKTPRVKKKCEAKSTGFLSLYPRSYL
jgi:hypothetical protein